MTIRLGEVPAVGMGRDAVHVAAMSCVAFEQLAPGQRVELDVNQRAIGAAVGVGIVDPFLTAYVEPGERFWLCLLPGSTSPPRHVWTCDAVDRPVSEKWLRDFAEGRDHTYEEVVRVASALIKKDESWEAERMDEPSLFEVPPEFWDHLERVTGLSGDRSVDYIGCRC